MRPELCPGCCAPSTRGRPCAACLALALDVADPWGTPHPLDLAQLLRALRRAMRGAAPGSVDVVALVRGMVGSSNKGRFMPLRGSRTGQPLTEKGCFDRGAGMLGHDAFAR
jgi:hypothetical protein